MLNLGTDDDCWHFIIVLGSHQALMLPRLHYTHLYTLLAELSAKPVREQITRGKVLQLSAADALCRAPCADSMMQAALCQAPSH